ncbi:TadE/TadG family type IV pilus assembly protein [Salsipaludibacter albus]|uniref:TadE/TadG family type IV pilus assembly protein n=1 Tax=Salsipaludibacter albus TaxID=2849650 RepID=UPI001EE4BF4D|nr:pilus assembly protein [Salsipaludibacter albus]
MTDRTCLGEQVEAEHDGLRRALADQDGASAVEFAIIAPVLFMLIFGIIQFGIFFAQDLALSNGARQAAREAAVPAPGDCAAIWAEARQGSIGIALDRTSPSFDVDVAVEGVAGSDLCPTDATVKVPCEGSPDAAEVKVTIRYVATLAIPLAGDFGGITLEREGNYRCEFN